MFKPLKSRSTLLLFSTFLAAETFWQHSISKKTFLKGFLNGISYFPLSVTYSQRYMKRRQKVLINYFMSNVMLLGELKSSWVLCFPTIYAWYLCQEKFPEATLLLLLWVCCVCVSGAQGMWNDKFPDERIWINIYNINNEILPLKCNPCLLNLYLKQ